MTCSQATAATETKGALVVPTSTAQLGKTGGLPEPPEN